MWKMDMQPNQKLIERFNRKHLQVYIYYNSNFTCWHGYYI